MDAVLFGAVSGALFGVLTVAVRSGLARGGDPLGGAVVTAAVGCALAAALAGGSELGRADFDPHSLWPFALAGAVVPGLSQLLFFRAVRDAGASRTGIVIGTAPLISATLAITILGEALRAPLVLGTAAIVAGAAFVAWERERPVGFRAVGLAAGVVAATLFAVRDTVVRSAALGTNADAVAACVVSLAAAAAVLLAALGVSARAGAPAARLRRSALPFLPAGLLLGLAYICLLEALDRGPVTVVAPLNATQSLWSVAAAAAVARRSEAVTGRLVVAAALVVAGGAVIGLSR